MTTPRFGFDTSEGLVRLGELGLDTRTKNIRDEGHLAVREAFRVQTGQLFDSLITTLRDLPMSLQEGAMPHLECARQRV